VHSAEDEQTRGPTLLTPERPNQITTTNSSTTNDIRNHNNSNEHSFASVNTLTHSEFAVGSTLSHANISQHGEVESNWVLSEPLAAAASSSAKALTAAVSTALRSKKQVNFAIEITEIIP
jgi:hypothetical protein